jgi:polar amino acid transport system permease protein
VSLTPPNEPSAGAPGLTTAADRRAARRQRTIRGGVIAAVSTVVVLGALAALLLSSPGWPTVRRTFFSSHAFSQSFGPILSGFWGDVRLFLLVEVAVLILGLLIALIRTTRTPALFPLRLICIVYVDLFRGIPTILVVYLVGFGVPALNLSGLPTGAYTLGGIALTLSYSAYVSEVFRSGIRSIHPSQGSAALALGLTRTQALRHVILPQAIRRVIPPLLNDFIALQKDVALVSIIGPQEAFRVAQIYAAQNFNYTPLLGAALLYLCVTIPLTRVLDVIQDRRIKAQSGVIAL